MSIDDESDWILAVIVVLLVGVLGFAMWHAMAQHDEAKACDRAGGTYIRAVNGPVCVKLERVES